MPTGYTAGIEDGKITTGKDFLTLCARAFGACIEMRDDPLSAPIPESFEPAGYYKDWVTEEEKALEKYLSLTPDEAQSIIDKEYQDKQKRCAEEIEKRKKIKQQYERIENEVRQWIPPTSEHQGIKEFALKQIAISWDSSNSIGIYEAEMQKPKENLADWWGTKIIQTKESLKRYRELWQEEVERTESKNKWLSDLRESLAKI